MLQVDDLSLSYHGNPVFEGVSFALSRKERCGFVGRNGSGKTSLLRLLVGQEMPDRGTISMPKGYRLGYLDQHIRFTKASVVEEAALGLCDQAEVYKAEALLLGLGFSKEDLDQDPHLFSGGYQLRLHLAKVLLSEPDCLLLDEPTNYLDILSIRFLENFLCSFSGEMILISHDREFLDRVTTHTLGLHRQKVLKCAGGTEALFEQIAIQESVHAKTVQNVEKKREQLQAFVDRFGAKATKAKQAGARKKQIDRLPALEQLRAFYDLNFDFLMAPFPGRQLLKADGLVFGYDTPLIQGVSLEIEKRERIAIIGKNGYGKSTLLRLLSGDLVPQEGGVKLSDNTRIGYFGQTHIQRLNPDLTIEEEIAAANPELNITQVKAICGQMLFGGDLADKRIGVLSGGEKSRVLLGKILSMPCNLLLLDEPTHHLDVESIEALMDAVDAFHGAVVIVTHSELILERLKADQLIVCHKDRQSVFRGSYPEFLEKIGWEEEQEEVAPSSGYQESKERRAKQKERESSLRKLEKRIQKLEEQEKACHERLVQASEAVDPETIQAVSQELSEITEELEKCYEEFMMLSS